MKKTITAIIFSLVPFLAFADVINPGNNPYPQATQAGVGADGGVGLIIIAIVIYFLFIKKSKD
jgi:multisubunit Na+/H+ antiporter MnhG subunit